MIAIKKLPKMIIFSLFALFILPAEKVNKIPVNEMIIGRIATDPMLEKKMKINKGQITTSVVQ